MGKSDVGVGKEMESRYLSVEQDLPYLPIHWFDVVELGFHLYYGSSPKPSEGYSADP